MTIRFLVNDYISSSIIEPRFINKLIILIRINCKNHVSYLKKWLYPTIRYWFNFLSNTTNEYSSCKMFNLNYTAVAQKGFNKSMEESKTSHDIIPCLSRQFLDPDIYSISTEVIFIWFFFCFFLKFHSYESNLCHQRISSENVIFSKDIGVILLWLNENVAI